MASKRSDEADEFEKRSDNVSHASSDQRDKHYAPSEHGDKRVQEVGRSWHMAQSQQGRQNEQNMQNEQDEQVMLTEIAGALAKFDDNINTKQPELAWFQQLVAGQRQAARKKLLRELAVFWFIGCGILMLLTFALLQHTWLFVALQASALCVGLLFVFRLAEPRERGRREER